MVFRKGQAALDFLMTYGWAIALVVIIAAVLFAMGLFDTSNFVGNKASGFSGVAVSSWRVDTNGDLSLKLMNQVGKRINVTSVAAQIGGTAVANTTATVMPTGGSATYTVAAVGGASTIGSGYTCNMTISYVDLDSSFAYVTAGTLTGKVA